MKAEKEEIWKFISEFYFCVINVAIESGKDGRKECGWKGSIFIWPFATALVLVIVLIVKAFIV